MLTYVPEHLKQAQRPDEWPWALLFLVFVWLWPGIISHDLWRPDEPTIYAAIQSVRQGNILAPILFGEYYLPNSPLFLWLASLSQSLFSPWAMESYTAVRLITALFMAIALSCAGGAGRRLAVGDEGDARSAYRAQRRGEVHTVQGHRRRARAGLRRDRPCAGAEGRARLAVRRRRGGAFRRTAAQASA